MLTQDNRLTTQILSVATNFLAVKHLIKGTDELHPLQCVDLVKMLWRKRGIVLYDTGLGKTYLAAAAINALNNEKPGMRYLVFVKKGQLAQTPAKFHKLTGLPILATNAAKKSIEAAMRVIDRYQVLMPTHHCLENKVFMDYLYEHKSEFRAVIFDEVHELSNLNNSTLAADADAIASAFEYAWGLTATPISTDAVQLARLAHLLDRETYDSIREMKRKLLNGEFWIGCDPCFFIDRDPADFGRKQKPKGLVRWCNPTAAQIACKTGGDPLMKVMKGPDAIPQVQELIRLIQENRPGRGVVYVRQHSVREWILPYLDEAGIQYGLVNGRTSDAEVEQVLYNFNEKKMYDVVITSVEESLDLDCEYVCFYEFTLGTKQVEGRAQRGFQDKQLLVYFMMTRGTAEPEYFLRSIYERSELIQRILRKSQSEIAEIRREIICVKRRSSTGRRLEESV